VQAHALDLVSSQIMLQKWKVIEVVEVKISLDVAR